ncbi:hypothetical protein chiPu_0032353, partial [Chiloscyllium punctatum]|nr:hypothetical protein [Chiloscyllium punctatum]
HRPRAAPGLPACRCFRRSCPPRREETARPHHQHGQEGEMAGQDLPFRIDPAPDRLSQPEHDTARQRAPQAAEAADDHGLERIEQPRRPDRRIETGTDAEHDSGDHRDREREPDRNRIDVALVDAHQLRDRGIVGGGAEGTAEPGAIEDQLKQRDGGDRRHQRRQRREADAETRGQRHRRGFEGAGLQAAAVCAIA